MARPALALTVLVAACGEPTRVRIVGTDGFEDVELVTLEDLDQIRGEVTEVWVGAQLHLERLSETRDGGVNREAVVAGARPMRAHYTVAEEVAVPLDFDTLMAFSLYAHLERAALYFEALGVTFDAPAPVYYEPAIGGASLQGVAYVTGVDFFAAAPAADNLPVTVSVGVLTHESSHRVWYTEVWREDLLDRLTAITSDTTQLAAYRLLRAVDEGVADYFGAVVSGNPAFHRDSFPDSTDRDLHADYAVAPEWVSGTVPMAGEVYNPYPLGMVLASCLWRSRHELGTDLDAAVVATLRSMGDPLAVSPLRYALGEFEVELLRRVDACEHFEDAYAVVWDRFASVCP